MSRKLRHLNNKGLAQSLLCVLLCSASNTQQLVDVNRSALVVVDVQDDFLSKLPLDERKSIVDRMQFLIRTAKYMKMPLIVTAENSPPNPGVTPELAAVLPDGQTIYDKLVWDLMGQEDIREGIQASKRDTFILIGLETDVCIAQSALGLQAAGYGVVVVEDATSSAPPHHEAGLRRIRDAGVTITTTKGLYYELVRDIPTEARVFNGVTANLTCPLRNCAADYTW